MQTNTPPAPAKAKPAGPVFPPEFQSAKIDAMTEADLISLLRRSDASTFEKAKACQRLATVGTKAAVPALAPLLSDPKLSTYARYGLEPIPDASANEVLREALAKTTGEPLIGVINSLGYRKDSGATAALAKLLYSEDAAVAQAAAAALGHISGPEAAKALQAGMSKTKAPVRTSVADAGLLCAEGLLAHGQREEALALYNSLTATDVPKPVRLAAMHGIIRTETSLRRPR